MPTALTAALLASALASSAEAPRPGTSLTVYSSADPAGFDPQRHVQHRQPRAAAATTPPAARVPSLREMGVDTRALSAPPEPVRTEVLRCSPAVLGAAQHLLDQPVPGLATVTPVLASDPVVFLRVLQLANLAT